MPLEGVPQNIPQERARKRPTMLAYHHEIAAHFPEREEFEREAINIAFAGPLNIDDSAHDSVWGYTPEALKTYMLPNQAAVVISTVSSDNKFSRGYNSCTGIVALGIDRETGLPISFLSHSDPHCLLGDSDVTSNERGVVLEKLAQRIKEMVSRCKLESLSFEIVGGGFVNNNTMIDLYERSVICLGDIVESNAGVRPYVAFGPNTELGRTRNTMASPQDRALVDGPTNTDVYVDTKNFGTTVVRPQQRNSRWNNSFIAPRNYKEWEELRDVYPTKGRVFSEGVLPLEHDMTEERELRRRNPERWKQLYGNKQ